MELGRVEFARVSVCPAQGKLQADAIGMGHGEDLMLVGVDAACAEPDVLGYANVRCICMWRVVVLRVRVCVCVLGVHSFPYVCARAHVCVCVLMRWR